MVLRLLTQFTYLAIFGLLAAAGVGFPFPEEVTQLSAGFLARRGVISFWPALACVYAGILVGDYALFRIGRRAGPRVLATRHMSRLVTPGRRRWIQSHFARHDFLTIMVARHASGLRVPTFAMAGAMGVKDRTFLLADALSALASVPIVVSLGYLFASNLERIKKNVHEVELALTVVTAAGVAIYVFLRRRRAAAAAEILHANPRHGET